MTDQIPQVGETEKIGYTAPTYIQNMNAITNLVRPRMTTAELAALMHVKPQTIRAGLSNAGHYAGLRPAVKLPSRRLLWDAEQVAAVINGKSPNLQKL